MTHLHLYDHTDNVLRRMGYAEVYCEDFIVVTGRCPAGIGDVCASVRFGTRQPISVRKPAGYKRSSPDL